MTKDGTAEGGFGTPSETDPTLANPGTGAITENQAQPSSRAFLWPIIILIILIIIAIVLYFYYKK
jgi:hypothetical protein